MSLYKRGKYWWVNITKPNGERVRYPAKTIDRKAALEFHDRLKSEFWRTSLLGETPSYSWKQAATRWLSETEHKVSQRDDINHLRELHPVMGELFLEDINRDVIERYMSLRKDSGVTNATVNRGLSLLRSILRRAHREWEWLDRVPAIKLLPEPKRRIRWLTTDEAKRLIALLPTHLQAMVRFTLATGLRRSNVTKLTWSQVDLSRCCMWVHPDQAKAGKAIPVPLNEDAVSALKYEEGKHPEYVFTYKGQPVTSVNTKAWRKALRNAGIENFRWHDLRHTWATWHVQSGTPLNVLQELGGWSSYEMVQRYAHLSADHLAHYADKLSRYSKIVTNLSHDI